MTDHFATLSQPRRPWLDADAVKDAFHRQGALLHPDVPGTGDADQFAAINAAYSVLRVPLSRLRHWLELTAPAALAAASPPPPELGDLFMEIATVRLRLDAFLAQREAATTLLSRALLASEDAGLRRDLEATLGRLETAEAAALEAVRVLDSRWSESAREGVALLVHAYHQLTYLARWLAQLREARFVFGP